MQLMGGAMGGSNPVALELNLGSPGAAGEAGALVSLYWRFMGEENPFSSKCLSFRTEIQALSICVCICGEKKQLSLSFAFSRCNDFLPTWFSL